MKENEFVTEELDDQMVDLEIEEPETPEQPEQPEQPKDNAGNYQKAMLAERALRKKAQERADQLQEILLRQQSAPTAEPSTDPLDAALSKLSSNEDNADLVAALKAMYAQTAKPHDDIMDLQIDRLSEQYPSAVEHKAEIIKAAKKHGIPVKSAYFMLYGEEAVSTPKDDILREAELVASIKRNSVAQITPTGNVPPSPEKRKDTIKVPAALVADIRNAGIPESQYAAFVRAKNQYPDGIPAHVLKQIYGSKAETKKG